jgi:hypothetical protein
MRRSLLAYLFCVGCPSGTPAGLVEGLTTDLLIVGGTESGCAAAVQAARMGVRSIVLVNDIDWLGGQFTAEALGAIDENRAAGGTNEVPFPRAGLFKELVDRIEAQNVRKYGQARPGNTIVKTTCRPAETERLFRDLLRPYVESGQLRIVPRQYPVAAEMDAGKTRLLGLRFRSTDKNPPPDAPELVVRARLTIDASDWGEAIKAAGAEYEFGPDLKDRYGEPSAPTDRAAYPIQDLNPITWNLVVVETDREEPIARPERYDDRRYFRTTTHTKAEHDALDWPQKNSACFGDMRANYRARRLVDGTTTRPPTDDVILFNRPTQNYPLWPWPRHVADALENSEAGASKKSFVQLSRAQREIVFTDAKLQALGFLYHLQTTVHDRLPEEQKPFSLRRFALTDEFGTPDRLPPKPYIRESIRLRAMYMMREQDSMRRESKDRYAESMYPDAIACWQFEYDFHPTGRMFLPGEGDAGPWECLSRKGRGWGPYSDRAVFPMRSLIPVRVDGLLVAEKNLGFSSLVGSAIRLHDQMMAIGQASGATAAVCLRHNLHPRELPFDAARVAEVRAGLCSRADGATPLTLWPFKDLAPSHPAFEAANLLAARGGLPLTRDEVAFQPQAQATPQWRAAVVALSLKTKDAASGPEPPAGELTRGEFIQRWWTAIRPLPERRPSRAKDFDFDGDGILDADDPLPTIPGKSTWQ